MPVVQTQGMWFVIECNQAAEVLEVVLVEGLQEHLFRAPSGASETVLLAAGILRYTQNGQSVASDLWYELTLEPEQPETPNLRIIRCVFASEQEIYHPMQVGLFLGDQEHVVLLEMSSQIAEWRLSRSDICDTVNPRRVKRPVLLKLYSASGAFSG